MSLCRLCRLAINSIPCFSMTNVPVEYNRWEEYCVTQQARHARAGRSSLLPTKPERYETRKSAKSHLIALTYSLNFKVYVRRGHAISALHSSRCRSHVSRTQKKIISQAFLFFLLLLLLLLLLFFFSFLTACSVLRTCVPQHGVGKNVRASTAHSLRLV